MWVSEAVVSSDLTCSLKPRKSERPAAPQDFPQEPWAWGGLPSALGHFVTAFTIALGTSPLA